MATPLRIGVSATTTGGASGGIRGPGFSGIGGSVRRHSLYTLNDNCDIVMLRDLSSSSDSLFTDPPLSLQSASVTAPVDSPLGDPCTATATDNENEDVDAEEDANRPDDDAVVRTATTTTTKNTNKNQTHIKPSYTAVQLPTTLEDLASAQANAPSTRGQRPLSEISIASGDTSGILSPTTARAIFELRKRHQADKLSLLSVAKTNYLEIVPTVLPTESSPESTDEQMAMHLGKKLAQVLSGNANGSGGGGSIANANIGIGGGGINASGAGTPGSPLPDNGNYCSATTTPTSTATSELFNIAKAKKIELPSLSSRLVASAAPSLDGHYHYTSNATGEFQLQLHTKHFTLWLMLQWQLGISKY